MLLQSCHVLIVWGIQCDLLKCMQQQKAVFVWYASSKWFIWIRCRIIEVSVCHSYLEKQYSYSRTAQHTSNMRQTVIQRQRWFASSLHAFSLITVQLSFTSAFAHLRLLDNAWHMCRKDTIFALLIHSVPLKHSQPEGVFNTVTNTVYGASQLCDKLSS